MTDHKFPPSGYSILRTLVTRPSCLRADASRTTIHLTPFGIFMCDRETHGLWYELAQDGAKIVERGPIGDKEWAKREKQLQRESEE